MTRSLRLLGAVVLALGAASGVDVDPQRYLGHVRLLASEQFGGRAIGSRELERTAEYIVRQFQSFGIKPAGAGGYSQYFDVTAQPRLAGENRFAWTNGQEHKLTPDTDFRPMSFSANGTFSGKVVFAGYGITAPEYDYDDYKGVDARGKFVLVFRHEPQEFDEDSVFAGRVATAHAQFDEKARNAKRHGALGLIVVWDRSHHSFERDELEKIDIPFAPGDAGIPVIQVKAEVAKEWISKTGRTLEQIEKEIDKDLKPRQAAIPDSLTVQIQVHIARETRKVRNIAGYLPGTTDEYVIIGAHYDHIGLGAQFSMEPSEAGKRVHPGADDNSSGTAGMLELARWFAKQPKKRRGILFLAFAGEEWGLLGSSYYVENPLLPLEKAVAMINLDMIGRLRKGEVYVNGTDTGSTFKQLLGEKNGHSAGKLKIEFADGGGYGSSDHFSFTKREVPVLFFFSGLHRDYHRPTDTWDKIDAPGAAMLLEYAGAAIEQLLETSDRPKFLKKYGAGANPPNAH